MSLQTNLAALARAFLGTAGNQTIGANGYQKLPSGLIIQWGAATIPAGGGTYTLTYPIAFPNGCAALMVTPQSNVNVWTFNTGTSTAEMDESSGSGAFVTWMAFGY